MSHAKVQDLILRYAQDTRISKSMKERLLGVFKDRLRFEGSRLVSVDTTRLDHAIYKRRFLTYLQDKVLPKQAVALPAAAPEADEMTEEEEEDDDAVEEEEADANEEDEPLQAQTAETVALQTQLALAESRLEATLRELEDLRRKRRHPEPAGAPSSSPAGPNKKRAVEPAGASSSLPEQKKRAVEPLIPDPFTVGVNLARWLRGSSR